jgi:hypothetical protein
MDKTLLLVGVSAALLVAGCVPVQQAPAPPAAEVVLPRQFPATDLPLSNEEADAAVTVAENEPAPVQPDAISPEVVRDVPVPRPVAPPKTAAAPIPAPVSSPPAPVTPKAATSASRAPAPAPVPPASAAQAPRPSPVAAAPPLDLAGLESRLRATKAIGVMTKLALKNQVDDLLDSFRSHYRGRSKTPLPELRAAYDRLLMKVLSLLQDGDPALAKKIVSSREAIWGILSDPKKFSENNLMAGA